MPENPPPGAAENHAVHRPAALTPEALEAVLGDFRHWVQEAAALGQGPLPPAPDETSLIDLHTLLGQLTALRHEVHLQTRATRSQQEQSAESLRKLSDALDLLEQNQSRLRHSEQQVSEMAIRPLLKTLVDVQDALMLAVREVRRVRETILPLFTRLGGGGVVISSDEGEPESPLACPEEGDEIESSAPATPEPTATNRDEGKDILTSLPSPPVPSFWARLFGWDRPLRQQQEIIAALSKALAEERASPKSAAVATALDSNLDKKEAPEPSPTTATGDNREVTREEKSPAPPPSLPWETVEQARQMLASLVTGYKMSVQRIDRALEQQGLEPISVVGQSFDPEYMEVLEAVPDSGYPPGEVLEEVRRGYVWNGRVFRYAQVRVARS